MDSTADCYRALLDGETLEHSALMSVKLINNILVRVVDELKSSRNFYDYEEWSIRPKLAEHWTNITEKDPDGRYSYPTEIRALAAASRDVTRTVLMREVPKEG